MKIRKSQWIGNEGNAFARVGLAFQVYGLQPPQPDCATCTGGYVANIIDQYRTTLDEAQVLGIIEYGLMSNTATLTHEIAVDMEPLYPLEEIGYNYHYYNNR